MAMNASRLEHGRDGRRLAMDAAIAADEVPEREARVRVVVMQGWQLCAVEQLAVIAIRNHSGRWTNAASLGTPSSLRTKSM
jgi:hypothetical protein